MKKIDPTKKVTPIPPRGLEAHCAASAATMKQSEPTANRTLIHQLRRRGRHQTGSPMRACSDTTRLLRCARERQCTSVPSGRRSTSRVTNGPGPSADTSSHPSASLR